jgi:hypothetical protein
MVTLLPYGTTFSGDRILRTVRVRVFVHGMVWCGLLTRLDWTAEWRGASSLIPPMDSAIRGLGGGAAKRGRCRCFSVNTALQSRRRRRRLILLNSFGNFETWMRYSVVFTAWVRTRIRITDDRALTSLSSSGTAARRCVALYSI